MARVGLAVWVGMALAALAAPGQASAACAAIPGYEPFRDSRAVAEGVLLGPSRNGVLFSPARLVVARYLKGSGRRVLPVGTIGSQISPFFSPLSRGISSESFPVRPGQTWRTFFDRPSSLFLGSACSSDSPIRRARVLRRIRGTLVRAGSRWSAWQLSGPAGVRCVRVGWREGAGGAQLGCTRSRTALAIAHRRGATGIAVAARGLRKVAVDGPRVKPVSTTVSPGDTVLIALPGVLELGDLSITATYAGGARRRLGASHRRAVDGNGIWAADSERPHGQGRLPAGCVTVDRIDDPGLTDQPDGSRSGVCGKSSYFYAVRQAGSEHTLVLGGGGRDVSSVRVESPAGTHSAALSGSGRAFIAALPGKIASKAVTVRIRLRSGAERTFRGKRSVNLSRPPRSSGL